MKRLFATITIALAAMFVFCSYCEAKSENTDCAEPYCRLVAAMELYEDEDSEESGISNDGNVHLFDLSGFYKSYYKNGLAWYASLKPRRCGNIFSPEVRTFFHYADGRIVEVFSKEELQQIKKQIYNDREKDECGKQRHKEE